MAVTQEEIEKYSKPSYVDKLAERKRLGKAKDTRGYRKVASGREVTLKGVVTTTTAFY